MNVTFDPHLFKHLFKKSPKFPNGSVVQEWFVIWSKRYVVKLIKFIHFNKSKNKKNIYTESVYFNRFMRMMYKKFWKYVHKIFTMHGLQEKLLWRVSERGFTVNVQEQLFRGMGQELIWIWIVLLTVFS